MGQVLLTGFGDWAGSSANPAKAVALAQNFVDATRYGIADETGAQPQRLIDPNGPVAYFATLPIRAGWVHLPSIPATAALEQNLGIPRMCIDTQIEGLRAGIAAAMAHSFDIDDPVKSNWQL